MKKRSPEAIQESTQEFPTHTIRGSKKKVITRNASHDVPLSSSMRASHPGGSGPASSEQLKNHEHEERKESGISHRAHPTSPREQHWFQHPPLLPGLCKHTITMKVLIHTTPQQFSIASITKHTPKQHTPALYESIIVSRGSSQVVNLCMWSTKKTCCVSSSILASQPSGRSSVIQYEQQMPHKGKKNRMRTSTNNGTMYVHQRNETTHPTRRLLA